MANAHELTPLLPTAGAHQQIQWRHVGVKVFFGAAVCGTVALHSFLTHAQLVGAVFALLVAALLLLAAPVALLVLTALLGLTAANAWRCGGGDCVSLKDAFAVALAGFGLPLAWLVWSAFNLGLAVEVSGLGKRMSLLIIKTFAKNPYSLGPSLLIIELITALLIPSNTARGGALIFPLVVSISKTVGSPSMERYLILCGLHANLLSSSALFYGTVGNPILAESAESTFSIEFGFVEWMIGASIPVLVLFFLIPRLCYYLAGVKTEDFNASIIIENSMQDLHQMGPISPSEVATAVILSGCLLTWVADVMPDGLVAMLGLNAMMIVGVLRWEDIRDNGKAWDSFFWLAGMVMIVEQMNKMGLSQAVGDWCRDVLINGMGPISSSLVLGFFYFVSMYLFSSITSHIVALSTPLMLAGKAAGCPPLLLTSLIAYSSGVSACLTSYSSGVVVMYFSQNSFSKKEWHLYGFFAALLYILVFGTVGVCWWKVLGWW
ncbi:Sodium/sulfate symporter [Obelidium mucronatum]|nr:Sodium/sulfate symporter [Obelidium mucronatum]